MAKDENIKRQIMDILFEVEGEAGQALKNGLRESADTIAKETRQNALSLWPNSKTGYPKNWIYTYNNDGSYVIYNKKTYRLAHLLENGHRIIKNGRVVGKAKAKPHIPKQDEVEKITTEIVEKRLNQL